MTLLEDLRRLWKEYMDYYIVGNKETKEVLFHVFLGVILTHLNWTYMEAGRPKSLRIHLFMVQDSGTGKSEMFKAMNRLLLFLGVKSLVTVKHNEPSLTGTIWKDKESGKIIKREGELSNLNCLIFEEGSILLKQSSYMDIITDVFQVVMDEPGRVVKGMRLGTLEYPTHTTVCGGSYMFAEFKKTLLTKGFLQRMFLTFKEFTKKEKRDMRIGVNLLKQRTNPAKIAAIQEGIKILLNRIPRGGDCIINFDSDDVLKFNIDLEEIYKNHIEGQFAGEKQTVLETFYSRLHLLIDRISAQKAIIEEKKVVSYEDMQYAKNLCLFHINSVLQIFDYLEREDVKTSVDEREQMIIIEIRRAEGRIMQKDLLNRLKELKRLGKWDLGYNRTLNFINRMLDNNVIFADVRERGVKHLVLE